MPFKDKEYAKEYARQYATTNKGALKNYKRQYQQENKEKLAEKKRQYYKDNKGAILEHNKQYREQNKEALSKQSKQYYETNKEAIIEKSVRYKNTKLQNDVGFRILNNCRRRICHAINGESKSAKTKELIGCTVDILLKHLENQFTNGMTWNNYGEWHIDHKKPCSLFNFENEAEQRECFNYKNLQPLWALDNLKKADKVL